MFSILNQFAKNFTDLLRIKGITQQEIAYKLGVKQNTISQWANGKREPDYDNLLRICFFLDTTPTEILGDSTAKRVLKQVEEENQKFIEEYSKPLTKEDIERVINNMKNLKM